MTYSHIHSHLQRAPSEGGTLAQIAPSAAPAWWRPSRHRRSCWPKAPHHPCPGTRGAGLSPALQLRHSLGRLNSHPKNRKLGGWSEAGWASRVSICLKLYLGSKATNAVIQVQCLVLISFCGILSDLNQYSVCLLKPGSVVHSRLNWDKLVFKSI